MFNLNLKQNVFFYLSQEFLLITSIFKKKSYYDDTYYD